MRKFTVSFVFYSIFLSCMSNTTAQTVATLSALNPGNDGGVEALAEQTFSAASEHTYTGHFPHYLPQSNVPPVAYPPQTKLLPSHQRYFALHAVSTHTWRLPKVMPFSEAAQ